MISPRIVIIHPEGNLTNNPNLLGMVEILSEQGYQVDIYARKRPGIFQPETVGSVQMVVTDLEDPQEIAVLFPAGSQPDMTTQAIVREHFAGCKLVIGIDRGIIEAASLAGFCGVPYGLISYEILFHEEAGIEFFARDVAAAQGAAFAVCQDRLRSLHLAKEYAIPQERIIDIPVAGRGVKAGPRNYLLHDMLGLEREMKLALAIGAVNCSWSGIAELIESSEQWPDDWALVLHHRYAQYDEELRRLLAGKQKRNVFLSPFRSLEFSSLATLLQAVDLGLGFYIPQEHSNDLSDRNNIRYIGMASGKLATYLQHGLPIMVNEIGEMSEHVRKAGLGYVMSDWSAIGSVLRGIDIAELGQKSTNALAFFATKLDLEVTIKPLLERISALVKPPADLQGQSPGVRTERKPQEPVHLLPRITMITPSYNQGGYLEACIDSILSQNYPNLEYIILDGGSSDGSVEIIKKYEKHLAFWQSRPDGGQYRALNEGFRRSTGDVMSWLNSDDMLRPGALQTVAAIMTNLTEVEWLSGKPHGILADGSQAWEVDYLPSWSRKKYIEKQYDEPYIQQEGTFWRRTLWEKAGSYIATYLDLAGDLELWARFFRYARLYSVDKVLASFRYHPLQKTATMMEQYRREADSVVARERALYERSSDNVLLDAPLSIVFSDDNEPYI